MTYKRENATGLLVSGSERLYNPLLLHLCSFVQSQREAVVEEFIYKAKPLEAMVVLTLTSNKQVSDIATKSLHEF